VSEQSLLEQILDPGALSACFQPVVESHGSGYRTHYLECLVRGPKGTSVERPDVLFSYVRRKHAEVAVDRACIRAIMSVAEAFPGEGSLGINVHSVTLAVDADFLIFIKEEAGRYGIDLARIIIEIVEHGVPRNGAAFGEALTGLRRLGVRVALDDIGLGHSNYKMILDCRPDYFKIDRYFVQGAGSDFYRQAVLKSVAELARPFGARVVVEGVENEADLAASRAAGATLFQGFAFSRALPGSAYRDAGAASG
jgi:EAL domain-containing protein (putative c-di-GMP-specific phosphodiesterase class I)